MASSEPVKVAAPGTYFFVTRMVPNSSGSPRQKFVVRLISVFAHPYPDNQSAEYQYFCEFPFDPKMLPTMFGAVSLIRPTQEELEDIHKMFSSEKTTKPERKMFQPGDCVRIRSGGPEMVIGSVTESDAHCGWFCGPGNSEFKTDRIPFGMLEHVPE